MKKLLSMALVLLSFNVAYAFDLKDHMDKFEDLGNTETFFDKYNIKAMCIGDYVFLSRANTGFLQFMRRVHTGLGYRSVPMRCEEFKFMMNDDHYNIDSYEVYRSTRIREMEENIKNINEASQKALEQKNNKEVK